MADNFSSKENGDWAWATEGASVDTENAKQTMTPLDVNKLRILISFNEK
jgi:hypothetical protein